MTKEEAALKLAKLMVVAGAAEHFASTIPMDFQEQGFTTVGPLLETMLAFGNEILAKQRELIRILEA